MQPLRILWRRLRRSVGSDALQRTLLTISDAIATVSTRGRPVYGQGDLERAGDLDSGAPPEGLYHTIANIDPDTLTAPDADDPITRTNSLDLAHANAVCLVWTHAVDPDVLTDTIAVTVWVYSGIGWVRCPGAAAVTLAPRQELRVETACRPVYIQVSGPTEGVNNINLHLGGEA